jgi:hypothetical protein
LLGLLPALIGVVSYAFYVRDILKGRTKPDGASWLIWGVLATIAFAAQFLSGGGAGAWITAFTALVCIAIATLEPISRLLAKWYVIGTALERTCLE